MNVLIPINEHGLFADKQGIARADSRFVAAEFGKRHDNVLRDIERLDCSEKFRLSNFGESTYLNEQNHRQPCYTMTRDGFTFLVMGYRGKKAAQFKELYIQRFNEMEALIAQVAAARMEHPLLTANIKALHEEPKPYHYSNEADMINRIVLGMSARQFREAHGIPKGESIRNRRGKRIRNNYSRHKALLLDTVQNEDSTGLRRQNMQMMSSDELVSIAEDAYGTLQGLAKKADVLATEAHGIAVNSRRYNMSMLPETALGWVSGWIHEIDGFLDDLRELSNQLMDKSAEQANEA